MGQQVNVSPSSGVFLRTPSKLLVLHHEFLGWLGRRLFKVSVPGLPLSATLTPQVLRPGILPSAVDVFENLEDRVACPQIRTVSHVFLFSDVTTLYC